MTTPSSNPDQGRLGNRAAVAWRSLKAIGDARRSVTGKLMALVLVTTTIALVVAGLSLVVTDISHDRRLWGDDLATAGRILALASAPALSFQDQSSAKRGLEAFRSTPSIRAAGLYTADGQLYAQYVPSGEAPPPARLPSWDLGLHFNSTQAELLQPILQDGQPLGTVYLRGHYDLGSRVWAYLGILALVLALGLAVALFAAGWLQGAITRPLASITDLARQIVEGREYSLRATKTTDDEFGLVIDAVNNMLAEIQAHAEALQRSNSALLEEARAREKTQEALRASERLYRAIGESIDYGVWLSDAEGRHIYASDSFLRLVGLSQEQCAGLGWTQTLHLEDRQATIDSWKQCVQTGRHWYHEYRVRGVDGQYHPILAQGVPIRDDAGMITRWAGINLDIDRMKRTELALREADRRKDEFLATLAHELRNPLAPIRNAVLILDSAAVDERRRKWGREVIARQVKHMGLLLDDLLDVSRVTRGQFELKKEYVELKSVCEVAVETARPLIEAKDHSLVVTLPPAPVTLEADPLRLAQVISNLLTNAAKYTDPGGTIQLSASLTDQELRISVADNGIGLAPDTIPTLFEMFSQVSTAIDRAQGGLGIGLALVKGLVALHGGTVEARSEGLGRGSQFVLHFPQRMVSSAAAGDAVGGSGSINSQSVGRVKVLVADDNRDAADTLSGVIELMGFEVITVYSGQEALDVGARERPQAVILDVGMPKLDGYDTARRLRLEAWGARVVLLALTGWGQEDDRLRAISAGFDEHLTKPIDPRRVQEVLVKQLQRRGESSHLPVQIVASGPMGSAS